MHLSKACPGVDFTVPYQPYDASFSIGDYVIEFLQKTFEIIKSSVDFIIVEFVKAGFIDADLPFSEDDLLKNLNCSHKMAQHVLLAQSSLFAVSFEPQQYKNLGPLDFVPFLVDARTNIRNGGYGMVEKVFQGSKSFARKTISSDIYDLEKIMMELKILRLATDSGNPHLLHLQCAYQQENSIFIVMYPWCEFDLMSAHNMPWWTKLALKEKVIDWMACLASGLSALHKNK